MFNKLFGASWVVIIGVPLLLLLLLPGESVLSLLTALLLTPFLIFLWLLRFPLLLLVLLAYWLLPLVVYGRGQQTIYAPHFTLLAFALVLLPFVAVEWQFFAGQMACLQQHQTLFTRVCSEFPALFLAIGALSAAVITFLMGVVSSTGDGRYTQVGHERN